MSFTLHKPDDIPPCPHCRRSRFWSAVGLALFVVCGSAVLGLAVRVFLLLALGG